MNRMILGGVFALAISPAFAADAVIVEEAPVAPVAAAAYDWSGLYIGGHLGYGFGDYTQFSASGEGVNVEVDGFIYGAQAGYNWQWNSFVFGVEADISNGPEGITPQGTAGPFWSCNTGDCNVDIEWLATVRGRAGVAVDRVLFYGTGGVAFAGVDGGIFNSPQQGGGSETGWTAGAGVEFAVTQNWTARAEYLHVDLGDIRFGTGAGTEPFEGDGSFGIARFGVNYKF